MGMTRRKLGQLALGAFPAAAVLWKSGGLLGAAQAARPNSQFAGVQIGMNTPYSLGTGNAVPAGDLLKLVLEVGVSALELRAQPIELFMGSPALEAQLARGGGAQAAAAMLQAAAAGAPTGNRGQAGGGARRRGTPLTPEQQEAQRAAAEETKKWRISAPTSKIREFRQMYETAGVKVEILKVDGLYGLSDEELDYFFQMAKEVGARAISAELPGRLGDTKRIGQFAEKHKMMVGNHAHQQGPLEFLEAFSYSRYNGANLDIGHYTATFNTSPIPFLKVHHDRVTHVHIKDRKFGTNGGQNMPFGQGDTPIREVLQLIRDKKWNVQATIEFEYLVPEGSTRMAELRKCVEYCRLALLA